MFKEAFRYIKILANSGTRERGHREPAKLFRQGLINQQSFFTAKSAQTRSVCLFSKILPFSIQCNVSAASNHKNARLNRGTTAVIVLLRHFCISLTQGIPSGRMKLSTRWIIDLLIVGD